MKRSNTKTALAAAAALVAAFAAVAEPAKAADDWTGSYIGLQFGAGRVTDELNGSDAIAGIKAGHDWQFDDWVVGVGVDTLHGQIGTDLGDIDALGQMKLRGGHVFGDTMAYLSVGSSYGNLRDVGSDWGYSAGVGVEHRLSERVSLTGEITQHRFNDFGGLGEVGATTATIGVNFRF